MVEYICPKCNKKMDRKDTFNKHIGRKFSCVPELKNFEKLEKELKEQKEEINELKNLIKSLNLIKS